MKCLKILLWLTAIGCLAAVPFLFLPWATVENIGAGFGLEAFPNSPIAIYYFKIAFGVFGLIGVFFIILARNPFAYEPMLQLGAYGLILFGLLALFLGNTLGIPSIVYLGDGLSGLILGTAILFFASKAKKALEV
jgi:FtsH-binding integral membrane protein